MSHDIPNAQSLLNYSFIAFPLAFAGLPLYIHMPDFYAREFGVSIGLLGGILLVIRLVDAFQDPLIGYISDKLQLYRSIVIYAGILLLIIGMGGLSLGVPLNGYAGLWFAFFMIIATTGFSIIAINLNMLGGFWTKSHHQRVRISSWREGFGLLGLLTAAVLPAVFQSHFSQALSFAFLFLVFGVLIIVATFFFRHFLATFKKAHISQDKASIFALFSILKSNNNLFFFICFLSYFSAALPAVLVLFFINEYLDAAALSGVFLSLYFISGAAFIGIWTKISKRIGLYNTWNLSMILSVVTFMGVAFLSSGDIIAYGILCILSGIALGGDLALPPAIIAGRITERSHQDYATQYYAFLTFLPKIAMAFAAGFSFLILEKSGFLLGSDNSESTLGILLILYAVVPCIIKSLSALILWILIKQEGKNYGIIERSTRHGTTSIS